MSPMKVRFTHHAEKRIQQRNVNHSSVLFIMYSLPFSEGVHEWDWPGTDIKIVYADHRLKREVITVIRKD